MNRMIVAAIVVLALAVGGYIWWSGQSEEPETTGEQSAPAADGTVTD